MAEDASIHTHVGKERAVGYPQSSFSSVIRGWVEDMCILPKGDMKHHGLHHSRLCKLMAKTYRPPDGFYGEFLEESPIFGQ